MKTEIFRLDVRIRASSNLFRTKAFGVLAALLTLASQAVAFDLSGEFLGTAQAEPLPLTPPHPESFYDGAAVQGHFEIHLPSPQLQPGAAADSAYFLNEGGWMSISYIVAGEHFDFHVDGNDPSTMPSVLLLDRWAWGAPSATFLTDYTPKYQGASFTLLGGPSGLFDGLDAGSLHVDPVRPPGFETSFASAAANMWISIDVSSVSFDATPPAPEPAIGAMGVLGALLMGGRLRRRVARRSADERSVETTGGLCEASRLARKLHRSLQAGSETAGFGTNAESQRERSRGLMTNCVRPPSALPSVHADCASTRHGGVVDQRWWCLRVPLGAMNDRKARSGRKHEPQGSGGALAVVGESAARGIELRRAADGVAAREGAVRGAVGVGSGRGVVSVATPSPQPPAAAGD